MTGTSLTFVLAHGAWYGAWAWDKVAEPLRHTGHTVYAPTLTGLGDRAEQLTPDVGLSTHVADVVELLRERDLAEVVLVGHSYAGFVARAAADAEPQRIRQLILVDAWVGADGESMFDRAPQWFTEAMSTFARRDGRRIPPPAPEQFGVHDPDEVAWLRARLSAQPLRSFVEPTRLTGSVDHIDTHAITMTPGNGMPFTEWARAFGWPVTHIASGHDVMTTAPTELVGELLAAAESTDS
ncbi:alpha/beta hydrolase [Nocardia abscessus]|uniref:alpha/beta fold hydrolase n=1 Tax=Nocardia abscessus TaxID=120957 RepID=UPI0018952F8E|nr:alpha/beta hydrolase [Nocardia abscessus]MBF6341675.1 alpha/beta hydrolase [Nocardia abscessus]